MECRSCGCDIIVIIIVVITIIIFPAITIIAFTIIIINNFINGYISIGNTFIKKQNRISLIGIDLRSTAHQVIPLIYWINKHLNNKK